MESLSSFGKTLRDIADREVDSEIKKKLYQLASQLELVFNQQANNVQAALGGAELSWEVRLDDVLREIRTTQDIGKDTQTAIQGVGSALQELSEVVRDQGAAVVQLRMEFQQVAEQVNDLVHDIEAVKVQSVKSSRDRKSIHSAMENVVEELHQMSVRLIELEKRIFKSK